MIQEQLRIGSEPDCEIVVDGLGVEAEMCRLHCLDANQIEVGNLVDGTGESKKVI